LDHPAAESQSGDAVAAVRFGDWCVHRTLNQIQRAGEIRRLEPKAMDVLACLIDRVGDVISHEELLQRVWPGRVVEDSAIHQRIASIRKALGDCARTPRYIETVASRGYRALAQNWQEPPASVAVLRFVDTSVERALAGKVVRLTIQLVDAGTDATVWSQTFERELNDVLTAQGEVARHFAHELSAIFDPGMPG
jgi:DNA-binding winged helix-turn-helix (wHTH) protein